MTKRAAQERTKEQRLVVGLLERQLNSLQNGNASRMTATFSTLSSWRQRGREDTEFTAKNSDTKEKPQVSTGDTRFTGVVIGTEIEKIQKNIPRAEEDGILFVVPVKINGKIFSAIIDSGATRCFVTRECCTIAGLSCKSHDTFLELGNGTTALPHGMV